MDLYAYRVMLSQIEWEREERKRSKRGSPPAPVARQIPYGTRKGESAAGCHAETASLKSPEVVLPSKQLIYCKSLRMC